MNNTDDLKRLLLKLAVYALIVWVICTVLGWLLPFIVAAVIGFKFFGPKNTAKPKEIK